jgi:hypothetical protein
MRNHPQNQNKTKNKERKRRERERERERERKSNKNGGYCNAKTKLRTSKQRLLKGAVVAVPVLNFPLFLSLSLICSKKPTFCNKRKANHHDNDPDKPTSKSTNKQS